MAKPVIISVAGESQSFSPTRVDRAKIYGFRKRVLLDANGQPCTKAVLTFDGNHLLKSGMTAQGYYADDGYWVARGEMVGIDSQGNTVESKPSTLGISQTASEKVDPSLVLNLEVQSIFHLEPEGDSSQILERLRSGEVLSAPFNYAAGLEIETAYIVGNDDGFFAIVGKPVNDVWAEEGMVFVPTEEEISDDFDFEAL